ncbi:MAG: Fe-S protein assembly co-chaperone HscB [Saprospiraceae bacterium]|nr:Fe-S protein assembly co-chaperone HscB [Saprospiraceae bacterium]
MPVSLAINTSDLRSLYLENNKRYHPDFHTLASEEAQEIALEHASLNNVAYKTLIDPDKRLQYVLELKGLLLADDSDVTLPQAFLFEMMEINEEIMELEFEPDQDKYHLIAKKLTTLESESFQKVQNLLEKWSENTGSLEELKNAREYFLKKRYLLRVKENLSKFAAAFE